MHAGGRGCALQSAARLGIELKISWPDDLYAISGRHTDLVLQAKEIEAFSK